MRRTTVALALSLLCLSSDLARAQLAACDALAADPADPDKPKDVAGVPDDKIYADRAVPACEAALAADPSSVRMKGQLVRALVPRKRPSDDARISRLFHEAAAAGYAPLQVSLGEALFDSDPASAMGWFEKAAKRGHVSAMDYYGRELDHFGMNDKAAIWYRKAAEAGDSDGMRDLAISLAVGRGVSKDLGEALVWNQKAAGKGNAYAMTGLGHAYENGEGVTENMVAAAQWYRKAADGGDPVAMTAYGRMLSGGTGVAKDDVEANAWYRRAAEHGDLDGMMLLAVNLDKGVGGSSNPEEGFALMRKVAEADQEESATAMGIVGFAYLAGRGVAKDDAKGLAWLRKAAQAGNTSATDYFAKLGQTDGAAK